MTSGFINVKVENDVPQIITESIGFKRLSGTNVKLFPQSWASSNQGLCATASMLSISSSKGLLAAGGLTCVAIHETKAVRNAFLLNESSKVYELAPQVTIDVPCVSHVAFSASGRYLVVAAVESSGGLLIFETDALNSKPLLPRARLSTEGVGIRSVVANPAIDHEQFFAVVLADGQLLFANLETMSFTPGANNSPVFKNQVSCVCWSPRGKQIAAGLSDGTCVQINPIGPVDVAVIPRPPTLSSDCYVSHLVWLSNDEFILVHTSNEVPSGCNTTVYHLFTRNSSRMCGIFQKIPDPCVPVSGGPTPARQFFERLRKFEPGLTDLLIVASSGSCDIGIISKSSSSLVSAGTGNTSPANIYTYTETANDDRRAQLPISLSNGVSDTFPVGMSLDLTCDELVRNVLPGEDREDSQTPLPAIMIMSQECVLSAWWIVYNDSLRNGTGYGELIAMKKTNEKCLNSGSVAVFGGNSVVGNADWSKASKSISSVGGVGGIQPAFGGPSNLGPRASVWVTGNGVGAKGAGVAFGQPGFGQLGGVANKLGDNLGSGNTGKGVGLGGFGSGTASPGWLGTGSTVATAGTGLNEKQAFPQVGLTGFGTFASTSSVSPSPFAQIAKQVRADKPVFSSNGLTDQSTIKASNEVFESGLGSFKLGSTLVQPTTTPLSSSSSSSMPANSGGNENSNGLFGLGPRGFQLSSVFTAVVGKQDEEQDDSMSNGTSPGGGMEGVDNFDINIGSSLDEESGCGNGESKLAVGGELLDMKLAKEKDKIKVEDESGKEIECGQVETNGVVGNSVERDISVCNSVGEKDGNSDGVKGFFGFPGSEIKTDRHSASPFQPSPLRKVDFAEESESSTPVGYMECRSPIQDKKEEKNEDGVVGGTENDVVNKVMEEMKIKVGELDEKFNGIVKEEKKVIARVNVGGANGNEETGRGVEGEEIERKHQGDEVKVLKSSEKELEDRVEVVFSRAGKETDFAKSWKLVDEEDEKIRWLIDKPVKASIKLDEFLPNRRLRMNVNENEDERKKWMKKDEFDIMINIERLYRDINNEIATLGLNGLALSSWITGQIELRKFGSVGRTREDLERDLEWEDGEVRRGRRVEDAWVLGELGDVQRLIEEISEQLERGKVEVMPSVSELIQSYNSSSVKLLRSLPILSRIIHRREIISSSCGEENENSLEIALIRSDLSDSINSLNNSIVNAENSSTILRSRLAFLHALTKSSTSSPTSSPSSAHLQKTLPTINSIEQVIEKLTRLCERRSGDIDALSARLNTMGLSSPTDPANSAVNEPGLGSSLAYQCPFSAPPQSPLPASYNTRRIASLMAKSKLIGRSLCEILHKQRR